MKDLDPNQQGDVRGLAVVAGGEALALGAVLAGDAEEAALWRFEADWGDTLPRGLDAQIDAIR